MRRWPGVSRITSGTSGQDAIPQWAVLMRFSAVQAQGPREEQQDRTLVLPEAGMAAVIDGVGGEADGRWCAGVVHDVLLLERRRTWDPAVLICAAHTQLVARQKTERRGRGGAAVVCAVVDQGYARIAWAGDCMALCVPPQGAVEVLTWPMNVAGAQWHRGLLPRGEAEYRTHGRRNWLLAHAGMDDPVQVESCTCWLPKGSHLVLTSDGAFDPLGSAEICAIVRCAGSQPAAALLAAAQSAGLDDNASIVVVSG